MKISPKGSLIAGALASIGASACCVGPLLLVTIGISGSWIGLLTDLEPYRPVFVLLTLSCLALAFRSLYLVRQPCGSGEACVSNRANSRQRLLFWVVAVAALVLLAFPLYVSFLL